MITGSAVCVSFKSELLRGLHHFDTDDFYIALYEATAPLDPDTTAHYITDGEIAGPGYTAGGQLLTMPQFLMMARIAYVDFDDPVWANSSITARGALVYNASYASAAVAILDFGRDQTSNNGNFQVQLPPPGPLTAFIRIA